MTEGNLVLKIFKSLLNLTSTNKLTTASENFEGFFVEENEKQQIMDILDQIDEFKESNNSIKRVQQLPNNNFFFAIHFVHTCYKIRKLSDNRVNLTEIIQQIVYMFDLFTHSQMSNPDNLSLFETNGNELEKNHLQHRFKKKFITFQHLGNHFINRSNNVLVSFHSLLEYFVDNVQQGQLFSFFPQLCAAGLHSNIVLYLYHNKQLVKKTFTNTLDSLTKNKTIQEYTDTSSRTFFENFKTFKLEEERPTFHFIIISDESCNKLKYFALFPFVLPDISPTKILEVLTKQWKEYSDKDSEFRLLQILQRAPKYFDDYLGRSIPYDVFSISMLF